MDKVKYPTGVENHGGTLRIWFNFKGKRVRENLGVPDTAKNRKIAGELRTSVCLPSAQEALIMLHSSLTPPTFRLLG